MFAEISQNALDSSYVQQHAASLVVPTHSKKMLRSYPQIKVNIEDDACFLSQRTAK